MLLQPMPFLSGPVVKNAEPPRCNDPPGDVVSVVPLSKVQEALWLDYLARPHASHYHLRLEVDLSDLNPSLERLLEIIQGLGKDHPMLRTTFHLETQTCVPFMAVHSPDTSMQSFEITNSEAQLSTSLRRGFDLSSEFSIRWVIHHNTDFQRGLVRTTYKLFAVGHHIAVDGSGFSILSRDILRLLEPTTEKASQEPTGCTYGEYVQRQDAYLKSDKGKAAKEFWMSQLVNTAPFLWSVARPSRKHADYRCMHTWAFLPNKGLQEWSALYKTSWFRVATTVVGLITDGIAVPAPHHDRALFVAFGARPGDFRNCISHMANTMPVKIPLASLLHQNANFAQAVQAFGKNLSNAKKHEMFPYLSLVEEVRKRMNKQHLDLKVAVTFSPKLADSRCSIYPVEGVWDLFFCFLEQDDGVSLGVIANPEVFDDEAMSKLQAGFLDTVKLTQTDASFRLQELPFLKAREVASIAQGPPSDDVEAINASRVHVWIKSRAAQQPNAVALFSAERNESMTYGDLARKSSQIAQYLAANKVKTGDGVLLHIDRGFDTVLWILGVLEVGAYYVVLDKKLPDRRKTAIISISEARFLVTDNFKIQQDIADMNMTIFNLDIVKQELQAQPNTTLQSMTDDDSLAYVVFTSGSTGQPKGVMVEHSNLSHYVSAARSVVKIGPGSRVLQFATFAFDASILEWAVTLSFGATLCFVNHPELLVGDYLTSVIDRNQINFFHTTPSVLATIPVERNLDSLTMISVGGEPSSAGLLGMWRQKAQILHAYGPTETTVIVTVEVLEKELCNDSLPSPSRIGKAFPNSEILICPENSNESNAPGQQGEICIAGVQVSRGYIGQPDLTKRSFQTIQRNGRNVRLYRSGDKGFIDKDGTVCISGRMKSREIKLRGYRMDLYEIEKSILDHSPEVQATSVQVVGDTLVAFIVPDTAPCDTIRDRLALDVPAYSVPGRFLAVKALPLNENGKIDHGKVHAQLEALSKPAKETSAVQKKQTHAHAVPQDMPTYRHISRALEELWMQTLNLTGKPAADTSFFEAGGHSITLVELHKGILKRFPGCKLSLLDIFQAPTIKTQASRLLGSLPLSDQHYASSESSLDDKTDSDDDTVPTSLESSLNLDDNKFAIVGLAGRFPKAVDVNEFWQILVEGKTGISTHESAVTPSDMAEDEIFVRRYGSLPELPALDVSAWNMTQEEADLMDPQKLLFLSVASEALADAEIPIAKGVPNPIGVFVGAAHNTHKDVPGMAIPTDSFQARHRGLLDPPISTFTAYKLNLTGPNATLNTACSSSLVALQHAISALRAGECSVALVGGVTVAFPRLGGYVTAPAQVFSPSGHCRPLSDDADGSVPADAVAAIVVKPLSIARRDNDAVYAVIEGCATGSDGAVDKIGFTVPSSSGQARAIAAAVRRAGVTPEMIRYVELHGSGTSMGDALEVNGLERALDELSKPSTTVEGVVHVGSNKGVFGNTEAASGLLSLTKMALALSNGFVPPMGDLGTPNSMCNFEGRLRPLLNALKLARDDRVGVTSLGYGGTNAHVVLGSAESYSVKGHERSE